jgi:hypothetical protein
MATAGDAKNSAHELSARHHLEELEALMQRMLALPVDPSGDQEDGQGDVTAAADFCFDDSEEKEDVDFQFDDSEHKEQVGDKNSRVEETEAAPSALSTVRIEDTLPAAPNVDAARTTNSPAGEDASEEVSPVVATPARSYVSLRPPQAPYLLRPILLVNRGFDRTAGWFGPPGRWAKSQQGKNVFGWLGLALLAAAVGWVMWDSMGWCW